MRNALLIASSSLLLFLSSSIALAAPPKPDEIPDTLRPWSDWVMHGQESARCPFFSGGDSTRCVWPARVELSLADKSGTFSQSWLVSSAKQEWLPLPGDAKHWPQGVSVDGASAVVIPRSGLPGVLLGRGTHTLRGSFGWDSLPESIAVPVETGLLALTVNGKSIDFPERDDAGRVWLSRKSDDAATENRLEIVVHRKVTDDVPLLLTTRVEMHVSGKSREAVLGKALPDGFVPMSLDSPMPARIEPDGHLKVQVWPGVWTLTVVARHTGKIDALTPPKTDTAWSPEEVWTFEARPNLRLVEVAGVPSIDPQQTTIPNDWKRLPTYRVKPGETMTLSEKRRGDSDPPPDQLALSRTLWLDFDGGGWSVQDHITGSLTRAWRLGMGPETTLGRVAIGGRDQFITQEKSGSPGVEVRQGSLDLTADSRMETSARSIPAVGWTHDFAAVSGVLQLPPGWRAFAAFGADDVPQTWIRSWSLLDMFLVLLLAVAVGRLYGTKWGAIALVALVLIFPEPGAPRFAWIAVLIGEALGRVVPANWFKKLMGAYRLIAIAVLLILAVPFWVRQVRGGLFPALEGPSRFESSWLDEIFGFGTYRSSAPPPATIAIMDGEMQNENGLAVNAPAPQKNFEPEAKVAEEVDGKLDKLEEDRRDQTKTENVKGKPKSNFRGSGWVDSSSVGGSGGRYADIAQMNYYEHDPKAMVQTGQGLPRWNWTSISLVWSGPVTASQKLSLLLVPPWANLVLALVRVLLCLSLVWLMLDIPKKWWPAMVSSLAPAKTAAGGLAALAIVFALAPSARAAEAPSQDLLNQLQQRLLEKPECFPNCASSPRMELEADASRLTLRLEIGAASATAVPLPGNSTQWLPERVSVDGNPASALARVGGQLWLVLEPGAHQVVLDGPLPKRSTVQISLPMRPHHVSAKTAGWTLAGLHEDGLADDNLQLARLESGDKSTATATLAQGSLPPFVRVERTLNLGLNWQVLTRVVRVTPAGTAVVLEVPLIAGENVTTNDVRVVAGRAQVNMGANASVVEWLSALTPGDAIKLTAPDAPSWTEIWRLDASPIWHADATGIPVVHATNSAVRTPEWHPWPGETVTIAMTRPEGVAGQTLTIDHASLDVRPGKRSTDATLSLSVRSSRGAQHVITLPDGAELQSVTIDGASQPIRQDKQTVALPVVPGHQEIALTWRANAGIGPMFVSPAVDLKSPSVNADVSVTVPSDRWVLFVGGPRLGPAVLFWSLLVIILITAALLSRATFTPLKIHHWILLGLGLSQIPVIAAAIPAGWLLALGWRKAKAKETGAITFNLAQVALLCWTPIALGFLFWAIGQGLLGTPEMQIRGNSSNEYFLRWFADRSATGIAQPWIVSVPLWVYHVSMLAWSLWLAFALLGWLKWGWTCFTEGGFYKALPKSERKPATPPAG